MTESGVAKFNPGHPDPLQPDEIARMMRGMTLRDWFAGQALAGFYANTEGMAALPKGSDANTIADMVYEQADAMILARDKERG